MFDFRTIMLLLFLSQNLCGQNDIFELARRGSVQEVKAVVKETPNVLNAKDQRGSTPLVLACYYNNFEVVEYLIQVVDNINGATKDGSPLMAAAVKGYNSIVQLLLDAGADPNIEDMNKTTALHYAATFKNYDLVIMLLNSGANPNHKNNINQSPYDLALIHNDKRLNKIFKIN